ncbi:ESX secretion-associated protein EspG [Nocardia farcinica]|uniref:ESX secretion-associated protein EspG n=1 Tax=Nocardia farcinica TaxID=37329 RepID=UPI00245599BA|nr:ESX secretion-associated protein EspG [Nocardia farcinica]
MSAIARWQFTALEFRVLWESTGRDVLPYPLRHRWVDTGEPNDFRLAWQAAARSVRDRLDDNLMRAVDVLLRPEARVEVAGFRGRGRDQRIRAHAGVHYQHGAIAVQEPGIDHEHGGDVRLTFLPAEQVPAAVIGTLPKCPPGKGDSLRVDVRDLAPRAGVHTDPWRRGPREVFDEFFARPTTCLAHVAVYPHGSVDNRHTEGRKDFQINDFEDGRYISFGEDVVVAKPAPEQALVHTLARRIEQTVRAVRDGRYAAR